MKTIASLLTSLIVAAWVVAIAILSVQNATPVSVNFLNFQSIQLPVGLLLAFSVGVGIIAMAITQPLFAGSRQARNDLDDDEFFSDN
jgi:uncharacterized integral membrane protein